MGFDTLLGNARLKDNLTTALGKGQGSHFYLISGPEGSGKHTLARLLSAALMCEGGEKPCLRCPSCRKVMDNVHPDFITVEDPEHKNVAVKIIRQVREDMFVRPNEGAVKIYFLPQSLGVEGQNALLKILEEPPAYGVFILLTDNAEKLLPTVRSRCVELKLQPLAPDLLGAALRKEFPQAEAVTISAAISRSGGYLGQAKALLSGEDVQVQQTVDAVQAFCDSNNLLLTTTLASMEKWKRDQLCEVLQQWLGIWEGALACRSGMQAISPLSGQLAARRSAAQLNAAAQNIQKAMTYAQSNVSPAAVCGWLSWVLR